MYKNTYNFIITIQTTERSIQHSAFQVMAQNGLLTHVKYLLDKKPLIRHN